MTDPIFKNRAELKKEYYFMIKEVLPSLNDCGYCGKIKCIYSKKFSVNCSSCINKCKNCFQFNKSKDILINCDDDQISNYIKNFLIDYFNASDLTNYFLKMNITDEFKWKNPINVIQIYDEKRIEPIVKKEKTDKNFFYCKSKKHRQYFKSK